jgi:hypothetical protein
VETVWIAGIIETIWAWTVSIIAACFVVVNASFIAFVLSEWATEISAVVVDRWAVNFSSWATSKVLALEGSSTVDIFTFAAVFIIYLTFVSKVGAVGVTFWATCDIVTIYDNHGSFNAANIFNLEIDLSFIATSFISAAIGVVDNVYSPVNTIWILTYSFASNIWVTTFRAYSGVYTVGEILSFTANFWSNTSIV